MRSKFCRISLFTLLVAGSWGMVAPVQAADEWMYKRSYFSHRLPEGVQDNHPVPESASAYRVAYYNETGGFAVRSAVRWNNYNLNVGGRSDHTLYREGWVEFRPN